MSSYTEGQTHQLVDAMEVVGFTAKHVTRLGQSSALLENLLRVLDGVAVINMVEASPKPIPAPEPPLDFLTRVDRSARPVYPDWAKKVMHRELEFSGPAEYDLETQVEEWRHDDQKAGVVKGQQIYNHLKATNALADQLGLADLLAIQAKGAKVFRALYGGKIVFGWKSVVQNRGIYGSLSVPFLYERDGRVVLRWGWLRSDWNSSNPALRFRK